MTNDVVWGDEKGLELVLMAEEDHWVSRWWLQLVPFVGPY
jgi:hypothetical protein